MAASAARRALSPGYWVRSDPRGGFALTEAALGWLKRLAFVAGCLPALGLALGALSDRLGPEPVDTLTRITGIWCLNFLLLTLAITPLRHFAGWFWPLRLRRMFGLFTFFYASLHFATYLVFEQFFDLGEIARDLAKRPFITAGMASYLILLPLALTSTHGMIRRLGLYWKPLHRTVYLAAIAAVLHFLWLVKRDITEPGLYGIALGLLLCVRLLRPRKRPPRPAG